MTDGAWKPNIAGKKSLEPDDDPKVVQSAAWLINPACSRNQKSPLIGGGEFTGGD